MIVVCRFASARGQLRLSRSIIVETDNDLFAIEHATFRLARSLFAMDWQYMRCTWETMDAVYSMSADRDDIYSGGQGK